MTNEPEEPSKSQEEPAPAGEQVHESPIPPQAPPPLYHQSPPPPQGLQHSSLARTLPEDQRPPELYVAVGVSALALGLIFSFIFGDATGIGFNEAIATIAFVAAWFWISTRSKVPVWRRVWAGVAVVFGCLVAWRDSPILLLVNQLLTFGFIGLACSPSYVPLMKRTWATFVDLCQVFFNFIFGWIFLFSEFPWGRLKIKRETSGVTSQVLSGVLISIPFLFIFGMLFAKAEARFSNIFADFFSTLLSVFFDHFWITFFVAVFSFGLFRSAFISESIAEENYDKAKPGMSLGIVESSTVLTLLNALFFVFVVTQLPYFFGGQDKVSATPGLAWSEYARSGFFELAWVTALLIPTLMLFMNVTRAETPGHRKLLFSLCVGLTALGGIVIASALQRMLLYTANYGLTELRVYVSAFIVMMALVLVLLNVLNFMGRERLFLPGALALGALFSIGIQVPNVQGMIATDIINRTLTGKKGDIEYLKRLSADAIPAVVESALQSEQKLELVDRILSRVTGGRTGYYWLDQPVSVYQALRSAATLGITPSRQSAEHSNRF